MLKPKDIVNQASDTAIEKGGYSIRKTLILSFLAGSYIAMGALLSIIVGFGFPSLSEMNPGLIRVLMGATFPIGLILVVLAGGELFTGNTAYFIPSTMSSKQPWHEAILNWTLVWIGNFIGALMFAYFLVYLTKVLDYSPWIDGVNSIAMSKVSNPFYVTLLKGIGANWLVCLAMWLGMTAHTTTGKIIGIWWPVMTFVAIGYEHSIANMFFIPIAMMQGADISISTLFLQNLIPATIGNIIGGAFFVGLLYWYIYTYRGNKTK